MEFAVIGGDMRQARLAEMLACDGHRVAAALMGDAVHKPCVVCDWRESEDMARYIILPLPASSGDGALNCPMVEERVEIRDIIERVRPDQTVLAGRIDAATRHMAETEGIRLIDYFEREELAVTNAAATVEGAIQILMEELPVTLLGSRILVIGFGRIGKLLSLRLRALGADVTVSARNFSDFAWIDALGLRHIDTRKLAGMLRGYGAIVNTVPSRILGEELLRQIDSECLCLDLASKPGGIDFSAASNQGLRAVWALSLPGKVAPITSGMAIKNAIYNIISELECTY